MKRAIAIAASALLGLACKARRDASPSEPAAPADAALAGADLEPCRAAAARVPGLPPTQRAQALIDACRPCGDWQALLTWSTPVADGGPSRAAIEQALMACKAFCGSGSRQRFLGALDAARGRSSRGPWRYLGEICKAEVSAVPDARFMGAPYFALDRIARALGGPGGVRDPALLAAIELPLPALTLNGVGVELPRSPHAVPEAGSAVLTVDAVQTQLGTLPIAKLSVSGLAVSGDYPGAAVALERLAAALAEPAPGGSSRTAPVTVIAPHAMPAARLAQVVAAAGGRDLRLAVALPGPGGWDLPGTVPIALIGRPATGGVRIALTAASDAALATARSAARADLQRAPPTIAVAADATVDGLAAVLGELVEREVATVALAAPARP